MTWEKVYSLSIFCTGVHCAWCLAILKSGTKLVKNLQLDSTV